MTVNMPPAAGLDEPVIVLTSARSGSTLVRLMLDSHPALACPGEISIVRVCAQLAGTWQVVYGDDLDCDRRSEMENAIRRILDELFGDYLARRGKQRWCEKSLGVAPQAGQFAHLYPKAKFICLYRHAMDVVYSALEAAPWGLVGYGFERFSEAAGGNNVAALAAYWMEHTSQILAFESQYPQRCLRVHYEHLAERPGEVADEMFSFIGVSRQPGIVERCFLNKGNMTGPGDHKLPSTNSVMTSSIGRGARIPVGMISPPQLRLMNTLLTKLGYTAVDESWSASPCPPPLLATAAARQDSPVGSQALDQLSAAALRAVETAILTRLREAGQQRMSAGTPGIEGKFGMVVYTTGLPRVVRAWRVHVEPGSVEVAAWDCGSGDGVGWTMTGDHQTWVALLSGHLSVAAAIRAGLLRYIGSAKKRTEGGAGLDDREGAARDRRVTAFSHLLGLDPAREAADIQDEDL